MAVCTIANQSSRKLAMGATEMISAALCEISGLGIRFDRLRVVGDFFPGGNVLRYYFNGEKDFTFQVLAMTSPVTETLTHLHILMRIVKKGPRWRDVANRAIFGLQCEISTFDDVWIWNRATPENERWPGVFVKMDKEVLTLRKRSETWKRRASQAAGCLVTNAAAMQARRSRCAGAR